MGDGETGVKGRGGIWRNDYRWGLYRGWGVWDELVCDEEGVVGGVMKGGWWKGGKKKRDI